ncbi:major facilitator superfamily domain-containing protein [Rhizoctonia solani]|nr:major facilitator superfamily domain-containing protein [Rhizoctonia solani]
MTSSKVRLLQVLLVIFINFFSTGIIFGFAVYNTGVYSWLCSPDEIDSVGSCNQQVRHPVTVIMASLPAGSILDWIGPTKTSITGATIFGLGCFVFGSGYTKWLVVFDGYYTGFFLLAIGSPLIFLSSFHISNAFPARSGLILSLVMAGFNASSTIFVLFDWLDRKTGGVSIQAWFWCYAVVPALFVVLQSLAGPPAAYQKQATPQQSQLSASATSAPTYGATSTDEPPSREATPPKDWSLLEQLFSRHFGLLLFFFSVYADRINWEIQTISEQSSFYLEDPRVALRTASLFSVLLPIGGIIGVPFFGWLLDHRTTFDASLVILVIGIAYGSLGMTHIVATQLVSISLFVVLRPLLYVFVGDYCGKAFGYNTFGRVYGLATMLVGLLGLILGPVDSLVKNQLDGNYDLVNSVWLILGFISSGLLCWSIRRGLNHGLRGDPLGPLVQ